ncbi:MAG: hypothetical protein ACSHYA_01405 [Opitutaceae bacterium]
MKMLSEIKVLKYLEDTLGLKAQFMPFSGASVLPYYLEEAYEVKVCQLLGQEFIALFAKHDDLTPASIEKHIEWCYKKTSKRGVFVVESLQAYNRKRLIERKVPFIVPGGQLYLPTLGLDLNEHLKAASHRVDVVAPASQVIILAALLGRLDPSETFTAMSLAARFGYSKMTMTRAIDELRGLGFVEGLGEGRYGEFQFMMTGEALWQRARPHMKSPVKKRIYLEEWSLPLDFMAGEFALGEVTMLGYAQRATWAVTNQQWKELQASPDVHMIPEVSKASAHAEFEIWSYDPALLSDRSVVDACSLALSLKDVADDRVQIAVDQLMEGIQW